VLVWRKKRRDGSPGATRRRLLAPVSSNGKGPKVKWQTPDEKSDEPFYCAGSLDELKRQIATAGGLLYIVENEVDAWSLHTLDIRNAVGTYSATAIPDDIASIWDELGAGRVIHLADNDKAGDNGATKVAILLLRAGWKGEAEFRRSKARAYRTRAMPMTCYAITTRIWRPPDPPRRRCLHSCRR